MAITRGLFIVAAGIAILQQAAHGASATPEQKPIDAGLFGDTSAKRESPFTEELDALAEEVMSQWRVPGISIAVVDGDSIFAKGFGLATLPDTPATPETLYYVGSTTKAQTAAVLAQLINAKTYPELSRGWSTPISSIIREDFVLLDEWATAHITLDDAASHRTGMAGHNNAWHREINGTQTTIRDIVRNARYLPYTVEPRTEWQYCNYMYVVLSHVIEVLTGQWLGDVMKEFIWKPLGMNSTYLSLQDAKDSSAHLASSYAWRSEDEKYEEQPFLGVEQISGAGGVISNVLDYAQWLKCLIHEREPFAKPVHRDIRTPRFVANAQLGYDTDVALYGLAWIRTIIHGQVVYWHSGSTLTFGALVYWLPDVKYGIVAFGNGATTSKEAELVLVRKLLEDKLNIPLHDRPDVNKHQAELAAQRQRDIKRADDILYPNRPKHPSPPSIKVAQMTGEYFHQGYGRMKLFKETPSVDSNETILVANRTELTWAQEWRLHHVSSDYWTLYDRSLLGIDSIIGVYAAEFKIGIDGEVSGLQVLMHDQETGINEGTILFQKVRET